MTTYHDVTGNHARFTRNIYHDGIHDGGLVD